MASQIALFLDWVALKFTNYWLTLLMILPEEFEIVELQPEITTRKPCNFKHGNSHKAVEFSGILNEQLRSGIINILQKSGIPLVFSPAC